MAYNQNLARDIENQLQQLNIAPISKKMFGGVCYMLGGNMLAGVYKDSLIMRIGIESAIKVLREPNVKFMDITKRVMKGWAMIEYDYLDDELLNRYISLCHDYVKTLPEKL